MTRKHLKPLNFLKLTLALGSCLLALTALTPTTYASSSQGASDVGGLVGASFANHDVGTHVTWGLTGHHNIMPQLNVGLYFQRFANDTTVAGGTKYSTSYNFIAGEANYLFTGQMEGAYLGGKLGWAITSVDLPNVSDKNNLVFGPSAGYDYALGNGVSLGGQFNILFRTGDPFLSDTNLLAVLKYNFL